MSGRYRSSAEDPSHSTCPANSRPALRAAAYGGRPRAGSTTTGTEAPASPSTPGATKHQRRRTKASPGLKALRRAAEPLPGLALVLNPARLVLVMELVLFRATTTRAPNPRECASDPVEHGGLPFCVSQDATVLLAWRMNKGRECRRAPDWTRLKPSLLVAGPHRGHIPPERQGQHRILAVEDAAAHRPTPDRCAGRLEAPTLSRTEKVRGSTSLTRPGGAEGRSCVVVGGALTAALVVAARGVPAPVVPQYPRRL